LAVVAEVVVVGEKAGHAVAREQDQEDARNDDSQPVFMKNLPHAYPLSR